MSNEYELALIAHEKRIDEMFGDYETLKLHTLPVETLEAMKNYYVAFSERLSELKTERFAAWNEAKTALKTIIDRKTQEHLTDLKGADKMRVASLYARLDCETEIKGVTILENEYKEASNKYSVYETVIRSLTQTISTVNKAREQQPFING